MASSSSGSAADSTSTGLPPGSTGPLDSSDTVGASSGAAARCGDGNVEGDEQCDDRNDDDLDGCLRDCRNGPIGIALEPGSTLTPYGSQSGGDPYDDACPEGEVVVGLRGEATDVVTRMRAVCGAIGLVDPQEIALGVVESSETPLRGEESGTPYEALCGTGSVVVGALLRSGSGVDQVRLRCAALTLSDDGRSLVVALGPADDLPPFGGNGGVQAPQTDCPPGELVAELNLRSGDRIDALGMSCSGLELVY
ncbi:MAG: hypothetical protein AAF721_05790 [Myxococcota bacterium]